MQTWCVKVNDLNECYESTKITSPEPVKDSRQVMKYEENCIRSNEQCNLNGDAGRVKLFRSGFHIPSPSKDKNNTIKMHTSVPSPLPHTKPQAHPYNVTLPFVCAFALATLLLMKSKNANCDALAPNSYTKREARYEPKMARR